MNRRIKKKIYNILKHIIGSKLTGKIRRNIITTKLEIKSKNSGKLEIDNLLTIFEHKYKVEIIVAKKPIKRCKHQRERIESNQVPLWDTLIGQSIRIFLVFLLSSL